MQQAAGPRQQFAAFSKPLKAVSLTQPALPPDSPLIHARPFSPRQQFAAYWNLVRRPVCCRGLSSAAFLFFVWFFFNFLFHVLLSSLDFEDIGGFSVWSFLLVNFAFSVLFTIGVFLSLYNLSS